MSKLANGKIIFKFNNSVLCIVYELNTWPRNLAKYFTLKSCLFETVKLTRNANKSKLTYNGRAMAFDGKGFNKKCRQN